MSDRPTLQDFIEVRRHFRLPDEALVEKDWFVVRALAAIAAAEPGPFQLVFQGGTALTRAHRVTSRTARALKPSSCVSRSTSRIFLIDIPIVAIGRPCGSQGLPIR